MLTGPTGAEVTRCFTGSGVFADDDAILEAMDGADEWALEGAVDEGVGVGDADLTFFGGGSNVDAECGDGGLGSSGRSRFVPATVAVVEDASSTGLLSADINGGTVGESSARFMVAVR